MSVLTGEQKAPWIPKSFLYRMDFRGQASPAPSGFLVISLFASLSCWWTSIVVLVQHPCCFLHQILLNKAATKYLLTQSVIAGIGNIYSDEILFAAKIHPARPANSLSKTEWERLAAVVSERLAYFIEKNALTPEEYLESKGQDYRNTPFLQVYGRSGETCSNCGTVLCRMTVGGRSSVYCPKCQRE